MCNSGAAVEYVRIPQILQSILTWAVWAHCVSNCHILSLTLKVSEEKLLLRFFVSGHSEVTCLDNSGFRTCLLLDVTFTVFS